VWLAQAPPSIAGTLQLDGIDASDPGATAWGALAAPVEPAALDAWLAAEAAHVELAPGSGGPMTAPAPPLAELVQHASALGPVGVETLGTTPGGAPALVLAPGDALVADVRYGAGVLVVNGTLDVQGELHWSGIVAATGGVTVGAAARLAIDGALWTGPAAVRLDGTASIRHADAAIAAADALLPLPRPPALRGMRDLG
jgi:hypothetical protein